VPTLREEGKEERRDRCRGDLRGRLSAHVKFVPTKNVEQQGILALHAARSLLVKQQTMLANAMRGLATEFGITVPKGIQKLDEPMTLVDADESVPKQAKQAITGLHDYGKDLNEGIETFEAEIVAHARHDETARRLATIPGIGPITASLIAATVVDISLFWSTGTAGRRQPWVAQQDRTRPQLSALTCPPPG
jgi:transposase